MPHGYIFFYEYHIDYQFFQKITVLNKPAEKISLENIRVNFLGACKDVKPIGKKCI